MPAEGGSGEIEATEIWSMSQVPGGSPGLVFGMDIIE